MTMYSLYKRGNLSKKEIVLLRKFQEIADEYFNENGTFPIIKSRGYLIYIDKEFFPSPLKKVVDELKKALKINPGDGDKYGW